MTPEHLSRFENGKLEKLGPPSDRLARAVTTAACDEEKVRDVLLSYADHLENRRGDEARPVFRLVNNRCRHAA